VFPAPHTLIGKMLAPISKLDFGAQGSGVWARPGPAAVSGRRGDAYRVAMRYEVTEADTAVMVGSGDVPVLATPRLIAWMEAATVRCAAPFLEAGQTTVGTAVRIEHHRPTPIGDSVEIDAEAPETAAGRRLTFAVRAIDGSGKVVAAGEIDRAIVDRDRFLG
jgi:fluoroacetyl-CoA thioesterase